LSEKVRRKGLFECGIIPPIEQFLIKQRVILTIKNNIFGGDITANNYVSWQFESKSLRKQ